MVKNSKFFSKFLAHPVGLGLGHALADLDGSTPECAQVCALHTGRHLASLRKIEMVAVRSTNETTPNFLSF